MEDCHSFVTDFGGIKGQGFFAVFDGHAGKDAAEWCGKHFHEYLLQCLQDTPDSSVPEVFNDTFHRVDDSIRRICEESEGKIHSGCTAVTAFLRVEDADGGQSFLQDNVPADSSQNSIASGASSPSSPDKAESSKKALIKNALKSIAGGSSSSSVANTSSSTSATDGGKAIVPPANSRRILYSANAGDARGVLSRNGKAVRLTYDHKGTDKQEAKRITDAGGFVMSGRVNGVLAVTRSLGDTSMKEFVVGSPYTTETELCDEDEFLVLACDGLWDVASDQTVVDLIQETNDAEQAAEILLEYALSNHSTDNVTVVVVRFKSSE